MGGYHTYVDANEEEDCKSEGQNKKKKNGNMLNVAYYQTCVTYMWTNLPGYCSRYFHAPPPEVLPRG